MSSEMIFCSYCNNLMVPHQDNELRQLKFECPQCSKVQYTHPFTASENCVEHLNYNFRPEEDILVAANLSKDPTLGRIYNWHCESCSGSEAIFFQLPERMSDDAMALVFVCCNETCGKWKKQEREDSDKFSEIPELNNLGDNFTNDKEFIKNKKIRS